MKKAIPVIIAISLIFLIVLGVFGYQAVQKYMPTKETAVLSEVYEVEGDDVALFYNFGRQEIQGIYEHGQTYLPLSWILGHINKRFYWDSTENLLVYTLPDQIVYADAETKGSNGAPLLLVKDEDVYLTLGLKVPSAVWMTWVRSMCHGIAAPVWDSSPARMSGRKSKCKKPHTQQLLLGVRLFYFSTMQGDNANTHPALCSLQ